MNIVVFQGKDDLLTNTLAQKLEKMQLKIIKSSIADEIDQIGKQLGMIVLLFNDPNPAYKFLSTNKWNDFRIFNVLYLPKLPNLHPEVQRKLNAVSLQIYAPENEARLFEDIKKFHSPGSDYDPALDIEFLVHLEMDMEKKK